MLPTVRIQLNRICRSTVSKFDLDHLIYHLVCQPCGANLFLMENWAIFTPPGGQTTMAVMKKSLTLMHTLILSLQSLIIRKVLMWSCRDIPGVQVALIWVNAIICMIWVSYRARMHNILDVSWFQYVSLSKESMSEIFKIKKHMMGLKFLLCNVAKMHLVTIAVQHIVLTTWLILLNNLSINEESLANESNYVPSINGAGFYGDADRNRQIMSGKKVKVKRKGIGFMSDI